MLFLSVSLAVAQWVGSSASAPSWEKSELYQTVQRVEMTLSLCAAAAAGLTLDEAQNAIDGVVYNAAGHDYLWRAESPLVLKYDKDGAFCGLASACYHWQTTRHPRLRGRLQGDWRARGVYVSGLQAGRPKVQANPYQTVSIQGTVLLYGTVPVPVMTLFAPSSRSTIVATYPDAVDQAHFDKLASLWWSERHLFWFGPAVLSISAGPDWVEITGWYPYQP